MSLPHQHHPVHRKSPCPRPFKTQKETQSHSQKNKEEAIDSRHHTSVRPYEAVAAPCCCRHVYANVQPSLARHRRRYAAAGNVQVEYKPEKRLSPCALFAPQMVELLERESSAMLYDKDATGNTALHWAATQGHDQVARREGLAGSG